MQITIKEILTTYWPQTVLMIAAVGFLAKRLLDLQTKKIETKHSIFQQNRNTAIMRFIDNYIELQGLYRQILTQKFEFDLIQNEDFLKSLDEKYEQLYSSYFYFKFFLDPLEQTRYSDLIIEMRNVSDEIMTVSNKFLSADKEQLKIELKTFISGKLGENSENFKIIGQIFRKNISQHYAIKI